MVNFKLLHVSSLLHLNDDFAMHTGRFSGCVAMVANIRHTEEYNNSRLQERWLIMGQSCWSSRIVVDLSLCC